MKCDVCGTNKDIAGVASSSLGPVSFCYCTNCVSIYAEPYSLLLYTYVDVGDCNKNNLADPVKSLYTWKGGSYLTFNEFLDQLSAAEIQEMKNSMKGCYDA